MKQYLLTLILFQTAFTTFAQSKNSFPKDFLGHWKGTLQWYTQGADTAKTVNMALNIQPHPDSAGQYTWHIVYGQPGQDSRPYILKPVDPVKGHWVIDEVNGIILDQYWIGGKFAGAFTVSTVTIVNSYWIEKGQLQVEFYSYPPKPLATTGKGTDDSPKVDSYQVRSYQRAVLSKQ